MHLHPRFSKAITPNRRLATAMKYLASRSAAEYRTIENLFDIPVTFVCDLH